MTGDNYMPPARKGAAGSNDAIGVDAPPPLVTLILLTALAVLPVNLIMPSLPAIAAEFRAEVALVNLSVAGYAVVTALTELIGGALSDRYGRRPVALASICIFIAASIGCALATDIGMFLVFRALQASIAACFSIALVIIKESSAEGRAASKLGYLAMGWAIAPMLGPLFGGLLDELFGWRSSFVAFAIIGAAALLLCWWQLREAAGRSSRSAEGHLSSYRQLLSSQRFWAYTLCMACSMGTLYVFLGGAPLIAGHAFNGSSALLGLHMGLIPAGFILGSYLAGRFSAHFSLGAVLVTGRCLTCAGLLAGLCLQLSGFDHILAFFVPCMFIGIGNGLIMPAANSGVLSVRADLAGTAAGLAGAITIGGGAMLSSLAGVFLAEVSYAYQLSGLLMVPASLALLAAIYAAYLERRAQQSTG